MTWTSDTGAVLTRNKEIPAQIHLLILCQTPGTSKGLGTPPLFLHPGFALEVKSLSEGSAEGECCGSCSSPPPAPPLVSPELTVEEPGFTTVKLGLDGEDSCLTASQG